MRRTLQRQLSDPSSPLYRSLSEIPTGLRPIRTTSFSEDGEGSAAASLGRSDGRKGRHDAGPVPRRRSAHPDMVNTSCQTAPGACWIPLQLAHSCKPCQDAFDWEV